MAAKPWILSTLILAALSIASWSEMKITITTGRFLTPSAQVSQSRPFVSTATNSASVSAQAAAQIAAPPRLDYAQVLGIPNYDKSVTPKTTITSLLQTESAQKVKDRLIPNEGTVTAYGLTINLKTYEEMKKWDKDIKLDGDNLVRAEKLIDETYHPCCGASISQKICGCGHAVGLRGLIKKMVQEGKGDAEVKGESFVWLKYFFPKHYVILGLYLEKLGRNLGEINHTQPYSSIDAQKPVIDYLVKT